MTRRFVRVRDTTTGHQFDVDARSLRGGMEPLNDPRWPDLEGPGARPRPALPFRGKGGEAALPADSTARPPAPATPAETPPPAPAPTADPGPGPRPDAAPAIDRPARRRTNRDPGDAGPPTGSDS